MTTNYPKYRPDFFHRVEITISETGASVEHTSDLHFEDDADLPAQLKSSAPADVRFHKSTKPGVTVRLFDIFDETPAITLGELRELVTAHLARKAEEVPS